MLYLEPRSRTSPLLQAATPVLAIVLTMIAGGLLFMVLGKNPVEAIRIIFIDNSYIIHLVIRFVSY